MKFPYGICDFRSIIEDRYFYLDRTAHIRNLEDAGRHLLFLRPRRFGKSLLLSMLENYYDVARGAEFEAIFGGLSIAKEPTPLHNRYFILKWDFSCVDPYGSLTEIKRSLFNHVNASIEAFARRYSELLEDEIRVAYEDPFISWKSLLSVIAQTPYKLYLLIDEYDNFANEVMMGAYGEYGTYKDLVQQDGPMKTLFKAVKAATAGQGLERIFITGVSPIVMSDITSGYNIAKDIHFESAFHDLCGFTEEEIETTLEAIMEEEGLGKDRVAEALSMMRTYYNGYRFAPERARAVYNPTLALYFFDQVVRQGRYPRKMLDANLAPDDTKLEYLARAASGRQAILDLVQTNRPLEVTDIIDRFKLEEMLDSNEQDDDFIGSFLYYFGMLTLGEEGGHPLKLCLVIPNLVIRGLYVERIRRMLMPTGILRDEGKAAAERLYMQGEIEPLCRFVETKLFAVFKNRDYRWMNEFSLRMAFLTLLYNDIGYMLDTEAQIGRGYADLVMIVRPDMRRFSLPDIVIEFKYVTLKEAGMTAETARSLEEGEVRALPAVEEAFSAARKQLSRYAQGLGNKYGQILRLRTFAVVSLGFERIVGGEVRRE